jgi:hypothetical protein
MDFICQVRQGMYQIANSPSLLAFSAQQIMRVAPALAFVRARATLFNDEPEIQNTAYRAGSHLTAILVRKQSLLVAFIVLHNFFNCLIETHSREASTGSSRQLGQAAGEPRIYRRECTLCHSFIRFQALCDGHPQRAQHDRGDPFSVSLCNPSPRGQRITLQCLRHQSS